MYEIDDYEDWRRQVGDSSGKVKDLDKYSDIQSLANFFEGIGVLVHRGLINVDVVEDLLANRIIWWWEFFEPINKGGKEELEDPKLHDHTRLLYHEMKHRQRLTTRPEVN